MPDTHSPGRTGADDERPGVPSCQPPGPPSKRLREGLRAAVLEHKLAAPRGHVPPVLWAGTPGASTPEGVCTFRPRGDERLDHDVRVELAVALGNRALLHVAEPMLWLTRSGDLEASPEDLWWQAAGVCAWAELGLTPSFAVLTRHGWRHHPSGAGQTWKRLRAPS